MRRKGGKVGHPPYADRAKVMQNVVVRCTPADRARWEGCAARWEMTLSQWMRHVLTVQAGGQED